ncbi:hypothetical protein SCUP234_09902 [Seiridium cupressi]
MAKYSLLSFITLGFQLINKISPAMGQDVPLFIQGGLEGATALDDTYNTGGSISLNGFDIVVPKNVLVQFPAAYVPWKDFVEDVDAMLGYEVNVIGNFVNNIPIAAEVIAYEFFEGLSSGYVESVNFADGSMKIRAGPTIRISDPNAVFSVGYTGAPFFTADDESPSISSFSGFPMCIPRNSSDPLCPSTNRPFQGVCNISIIAPNVQITTLQDLVYIRTELGLLGIDSFNTNTELAESRFVGFVSNARATVALYAMDYDPCTGAVTDRIVAAMGLKGGRNEQNKFEYRADITRGYARDYRVVAEIDSVPKTRTTKNGLLAGTYVQPVNVWVQAEQLTPGTPPPGNDFSQMPWLTQGVGVDEFGNLWGPLDPFPQTGILIDAPGCGSVSALTFKGDAVPEFEPSSVLLNQTLPANFTDASNESNATVTSGVSAVKKRGVPNVRWMSRARLEATTLPADDPRLVQVLAPEAE